MKPSLSSVKAGLILGIGFFIALMFINGASATIIAFYDATPTNGYPIGGGTYNGSSQIFTPNSSLSSGSIDNATVYLYRSGADGNTRSLQCGFYGVEAGHSNLSTKYGDNYTASVDTTLLGTVLSTPLPITILPGGTKATFTNNTQMSIYCVIYTTATFIGWSLKEPGGTYPGGAMSYRNGGTWNDNAGADANFSISGSSAAPPSSSNNSYAVKINESWNGTPISGANVTLYNATATIYSALTNSTGDIYYTSNTTLDASLSYNVTKANYFSVTGATVAVNGTGYSNLTTVHVQYFNISTLITGTDIKLYNLSVVGGHVFNTSASSGLINMYLPAYPVNITFQKAGYYNFTFQKNFAALTNGSDSATGAYNAVLNVSAFQIITNTTVTNYTVTLTNSTYAYTSSQNYSASYGGTAFLVEQGLPLFASIDAPAYVLNNATITPNATTYNYQFTLYTNNSVYVTILKEADGLPIYENISITIAGNSSTVTNYTNTSTFYVDSLLDGEYTFRFSGTNYSLKTYTVTVGSRSTQSLTAYLSATTDTTIFTYQDSSTGETLEGVSSTMYRLINGSWSVVDAKTSDITGRVQFAYTVGIKYKFYSSFTGYADKTFYLDPVLFTSYTINLQKTVTLSNTSQGTGVSVIFAPKSYANNDTGNFTILITSPDGVLISYGLMLTYPGTSVTYTGANANGGQFNHTYDLINATGNDNFTISYWYNSTLEGFRNFTYKYRIKGIYGTTSIEALKRNKFGMGLFETVLISILLAGVVAGVATMIAGAVIGAALGLLVLGFFVYLGFIPIWLTVISFIIGFVLLVRRTD